jgi:hypothetical protein
VIRTASGSIPAHVNPPAGGGEDSLAGMGADRFQRKFSNCGAEPPGVHFVLWMA